MSTGFTLLQRGCNKGYANNQSLSKHRKICKVLKSGSGFLFTQASNGVVPKRKVMQLNNHLDEEEEICSDGEDLESSEESTIADIVEDENAAESDEEDNVDEEDEGDYFWPLIYQICKVKDEDHFLKAYAEYLLLYFQSKEKRVQLNYQIMV